MELTDLSPMPFGKHRNEPMQDVPASYLHWWWHANLNQSSSPVAGYIRRNMSALQQETPDLEWDVPRVSAPVPQTKLEDGLYQVTTSSFVAGFVVRANVVKAAECAPILRKNLKYWVKSAIKVGDVPTGNFVPPFLQL